MSAVPEMDASLEKQIVLIVDDTPENITILCSLLRGQYRTRIATNGMSALEIVSSKDDRPDLILLDIRMPVMDGYEVCRRLKENELMRDIPVIFLSSLHEMVDKVKAFAVGGIDYVTKPYRAEEVQARVATHLKLRRLQRDMEKQNGKLLDLNEQLRDLHALKDEFIGIGSHDLRGLLTCILGYASIFETDIPLGTPMTEEMRSWAAIIANQCEVMKKIIGDFLDFQAMEDGQIKLTVETVDLIGLMREVLERYAGYAAIKRIALKLDLECETFPIKADKSRLNQVLENFVSNAIKFSRRGEHVSVGARKTEEGILVEVRDSGPGLTEDDMKKLFIKYAKLSSLPTGGEKSSGLGLAICKKVIELQGGNIGARNNQEGGSTFWFVLPEQQAYCGLSGPAAHEMETGILPG